MLGLRARLVAVTVLVAAGAVIVSAVLSGQVVRHEIRRLERPSPAVGLDGVAVALAARARPAGMPGGAWPGADTLLASRAPATGHALLLAAADGRVVGASVPALRAARAEASAGGRLRVFDPHGSLQLELIHPEAVAVPPARGAPGAVLYALPPIAPEAAGTHAFLGSVTRGLALGALLAVALGTLAGALFAGRLTRPLAALTAAASRMERGDLAARVTPCGRDELATLGRAFNAMAAELERAGAARRQTARDLAHELRTPLAGLVAQIEAMQDGLLAPGDGALRSMHQEAQLLARLIDDLQQLAEAEAGELRLDLAEVPLDAALADAAAAFAPAAAQRGVAIEIEAAGAAVARADALRLGQVLRNLVANALDHTPAGGSITLSAREAGGRCEIVVADTGDGIAAEHVPRVFERFYRADASRSRATGGAGLGLAIVEQLVRAQGGDVGIESVPGRGTRVVVRLPGG